MRLRARARTLEIFAALIAVGGVVVGLICMVHTTEPGCTGWTGCGDNHPLIAVGLIWIVMGLLVGAAFVVMSGVLHEVAENQPEMHTSDINH